jgi:hypothetical protein
MDILHYNLVFELASHLPVDTTPLRGDGAGRLEIGRPKN